MLAQDIWSSDRRIGKAREQIERTSPDQPSSPQSDDLDRSAPIGSAKCGWNNDMTNNNSPVNTSLVRLARALRTAFKLDQRRQPRMPADGSLHLLFQPHDGPISTDSVDLQDMFPGGFAFRSPRLFCVGSHVCLSDGIEAMEVSIEFRREDHTDFVYVVNLGDLDPLPEHWRQRLNIMATRLEAIVARCQVHGEVAFDAH